MKDLALPKILYVNIRSKLVVYQNPTNSTLKNFYWIGSWNRGQVAYPLVVTLFIFHLTVLGFALSSTLQA